MNQRYDLYSQVHKGIRLALHSLCYQAGSVDSSEEERVRTFIEEFRRIVCILEAHSRDEDAYLNEAYEQYAPATLHELEEEHSGLEMDLQKLVELVNRLELTKQDEAHRPEIWYQLGKDLNRFAADYLIHLQREEGPGLKALWEHLTDDQLKVISHHIRSSIPPETMAIFMHYMMPAISHQERVDILREMKRVAPAEAYEGMLGLAKARLDARSWGQLRAALEISDTGVAAG